MRRRALLKAAALVIYPLNQKRVDDIERELASRRAAVAAVRLVLLRVDAFVAAPGGAAQGPGGDTDLPIMNNCHLSFRIQPAPAQNPRTQRR